VIFLVVIISLFIESIFYPNDYIANTHTHMAQKFVAMKGIQRPYEALIGAKFTRRLQCNQDCALCSTDQNAIICVPLEIQFSLQ
jgi:hypothetical protein